MPTLEHQRTRVRQDEPPAQRGGGPSIKTLIAASVASVAAAIVTSHVWGPGTLYSAAATPIIIAIVSDLVQRPRQVVDTARRARATRAYDPIAEGRRGLEDGDFRAARIDDGDRTVHRASARPVPRRRTLLAAVATGLLAFGVAAFALTGGELVFGKESVGGVSSRTTLFGGSKDNSTTTDGQGKQDPAATDTSTTPSPTGTQEQPQTTTTAPPQSTTTTAPQPTAPQQTAPQPQTTAPTGPQTTTPQAPAPAAP